jgi:hypothetical protein
MELFYRLVIDTGLILFILLSTIIGNIMVSFAWIEILGLPISLKSLSFGLGTIFIGIPSFCPVIISSYIYGNIAYNINHKFDYLDISLVAVCCFLGMFTIMGGGEISGDLKKSEESRKQGWTYQLWWERIDESLTPAVVITLLIVSGLIISCYFNGLS